MLKPWPIYRSLSLGIKALWMKNGEGDIRPLDNREGMEMVWKKRITQETGSMTLELAIIFPMIICLLIVLIYSLLLYYQQAITRATVDQTVNQVSFIWGRLQEGEANTRLLQQGALLNTREDLYWQMGVFDHKAEKKDLIEDYLKKELKKKELLTPKSTDIEVSFHNYFIFQRIKITATLTYDPPFPFIKYFLNGKLQVSASALVKEPSEIIRNVDYAGDLLEEFQTTQKLKTEFLEKMKEAQKKVQDFFK